MRRATPGDIPQLVDLMAEFYAEGAYRLDRPRAAAAFAAILADQRLGYVWLIQTDHQDVGHLVLTLRYAMEYGGLIACLDDLFVRPAWRNRGLSTAALLEVRDFCVTNGIAALTVEAGHQNAPAQAAYRRVGFAAAVDRELLVLPLAAPAHFS